MQAIGCERKFSKAWEGRTDIVKWEVIEIRSYEKIRFEFLGSNSKYRQGIRIAIDYGNGKLKFGDIENKSFQVWMDNAPSIFDIECFSDEGKLSLYNIWDEGSGAQSQSYTSGMIVKTEGIKSVYHCNDFGKETVFDKLIFSIEREA